MLQPSQDGLCEQLTLAITWPQSLFVVAVSHEVAAQVNGGVREWQECQA